MTGPGYVTNGEISGPAFLAGLNLDVDLGGLKFSYQWGPFYVPVAQELPIKLPPPMAGET
jgi:hypothetical protein